MTIGKEEFVFAKFVERDEEPRAALDESMKPIDPRDVEKECDMCRRSIESKNAPAEGGGVRTCTL